LREIKGVDDINNSEGFSFSLKRRIFDEIALDLIEKIVDFIDLELVGEEDVPFFPRGETLSFFLGLPFSLEAFSLSGRCFWSLDEEGG